MSPFEGTQMDELLPMSTKEITRLEVMQRLKDKRVRQKEAAHLLGVSVRQVKRLWRKYRKGGAKGLLSKKRGQASNNRLDAGVVQQTLDLIKQKYADFGPTLAHEKLVEVDHIGFSRESVRKIMIEEKIWKPRRAKKAAVHQLRERRACFGELIQIDGSDHAWFEERGERCTLLVFIDDATGKLVALYFVPEETFFGYCEAARHYFERYGKPLAFYSDRHGIFVNTPQPLGTTNGLTQFGRAMQELDIQIICAHLPGQGSRNVSSKLCKTAWSRNYACVTSRSLRQPMLSYTNFEKISIAVLPFPLAAPRMPIVPCAPAINWI
jgi:transposase